MQRDCPLETMLWKSPATVIAIKEQGGGQAREGPGHILLPPLLDPASYLHLPLVRGQRRLGDVVRRDVLPGQRAVQRQTGNVEPGEGRGQVEIK